MNNDIIDSGISDSETLASTPTVDDKQAKANAKAKAEFKELQQLAKSPAWKRLRSKFQEKIDKTNKFDYVNYAGDDKQVGQEVKIHKLLANELNEFMAEIDNSIEKREINE